MNLRSARVALVMLLLLSGAIGTGRSGAGQGQLVPGALTIDAPAVIAAGDPLTVRVSSPVAENTTVTLGLSGSYGLQLWQAPIRSGVATFEIPPGQTEKSGVAVLSAAMNGLHSETTVTITPGPAVDPVKPLVGARSIEADGSSWSMVVVAPVDRFGNPVADGTAVNLAMTRPATGGQSAALATDHLVAWTRITSGTTTGRTTVAATAGGAPGPQAVLEEVPGPPAAITVQAAPASAPADGRSYLSLSTGKLVDANGNVVVDGTAITFTATTAGGPVFSIPAETISGVAEARLLAPEQPESLSVVAECMGVVSAPVMVSFTSGPAVGTIPLSATLSGGELVMSAGPIVTALGDYTADGVTATFKISGMGTAIERTAPVLSGYAGVSLPIAGLVAGEYEAVVTVGSASGTTRVTIP